MASITRRTKRENISVCIQPDAAFGGGGISNTLAYWNYVLDHTLSSGAALKFKFNYFHMQERHHGDPLDLIDQTSDVSAIFYSEERDKGGVGCRRDGKNGNTSKPAFNAVCQINSCMFEQLTLLVDNDTERLSDGDTIRIGIAPQFLHTLHIYTKTRAIFHDRYWNNVNNIKGLTATTDTADNGNGTDPDKLVRHPDSLLSSSPTATVINHIHMSGMLAIAVHIRNGDVTPSDNSISNKSIYAMRYVQAEAYRPLMEELVHIPSSCASILIVTEDAEDPEVLKVIENFEQDSTALGIKPHKITVLGSNVCGYDCALRTMIHADVLIAGFSGFSIVASMLAQDSQVVAYTNTSDNRIVQRREESGREFVLSPSELKRKVSEKCNHVFSRRERKEG